MKIVESLRSVALACAVGLACNSPVYAQNFPSKPIKIMMAFAAGGPSDLIARALAQQMSGPLGVQVVVENRLGGSGVVGTMAGAQAAPDGYTLTFATTAVFASLPNLRKDLPYDPVKSFAPISLVSSVPFFFIVNSSIPARTLGELISYAKANPGLLNMGSPGLATAHHLTLEWFKTRTGVDIVHAPYPGSGQVIPDLLQGRVQMTIDNAVALMPHIKGGKLRVLAVASAARNPALPDIPTVIESGIPEFEMFAWNGLVAPAGTPKDIVARLFREVIAASETARMREDLAKLSVDSLTSKSPEEFGRHIEKQVRVYGDLVKAAKMSKE